MVGVLPVPGVYSDREVSVCACLPSVVCLRAVCGVSLDLLGNSVFGCVYVPFVVLD